MKEPRTRWRILLIPSRSGAENMARDEGLMARARESGESVFSVYAWEKPTLSLGRNQTARDLYDLQELNRRGVDVVRRPTGGRALLHHREVTYSVAAPIADGESLAETYRHINMILLDGLAKLGVDARESVRAEPTPRPDTLPCFAAPADGELVTRGAKLVGSAQVRENGAFLQHGSILIEDDQRLIAELLISGSHDLRVPQAATLSESLGRAPAIEEVATALFDSVKRLKDPNALSLAETDIARFTAAHVEKYRSELWTWRR